VTGFESKTAHIDGIRTHYLEAGSGEPVVLIHGGEFGGCAEIAWEFTIAPLAEHYRVVAPDILGYGRSEKLFSFENFWEKRVVHIGALLRYLGIEAAHFIGNSMGGTMILGEAARRDSTWPIASIVSVCGGSPVNESARKVLHAYDLSLEGARAITELLVQNKELRSDPAYIRRRHEISLIPGAWEATAAARFQAPNRKSGSARPALRPEAIDVPVLIVGGSDDPVNDLAFAPTLAAAIPDAELCMIEGAGHCPQIDRPDLFNAKTVEFLKSHPLDRAVNGRKAS
jgi:pimeloyl-ACP methyl ester carboxylesterase